MAFHAALKNSLPASTSTSVVSINLFDFKSLTHGGEVINGGDLAFDREEMPLQPVGWQPEEEDGQLDELRLNVVEVK